ncbi:MAG TPA: DUF2232 domain-containing protein [Rhodospirillales bacterium]|nr:DUF2232 domain-containing protein [Rhodospirillales bacterium]
MSKSMLIAVGGGGLSAAASLAGQFGVPGAVLVACLAPLPLLAIGLALGPKAAAAAAGTGILFALAVAGLAAASVYAGLHALPAALVVDRALAGGVSADGARAAGVALASLAIFVAILAATIASIGRGDAGIEATVRGFLDEGLAATMGGLPVDARLRFIETAAPMFVGLSGTSWQLLIAVNGLIAQRIVSRPGQAVRQTPAWSRRTLPDWLAWPLVGAAAISLVTGGDAQYLARNVAMILATPYFFLGLTVVHALARRTGGKAPLLTVFYIILVIFTLVAGAIVAGLGMIEQWVGLRERITASPARKE